MSLLKLPDAIRTKIDDYIGLFAGPRSHLINTNRPILADELAQATWIAIDAAFGATLSHNYMLKQFGLPSIVPAVQFNMNIDGLVNAMTSIDALCFLPARVARLLTDGSGVKEITFGLPAEARQLAIWHPADADLNSRLVDAIRKCRAFLAKRLCMTEG